MRTFVAMVATILLAGCTDADWAHALSYDTPSAAPVYPPDMVPAAPPAVSVRPAAAVSDKAARQCADAANERAGDMTYQDIDAETMQRVHDATYTDCMAWASHLKL